MFDSDWAGHSNSTVNLIYYDKTNIANPKYGNGTSFHATELATNSIVNATASRTVFGIPAPHASFLYNPNYSGLKYAGKEFLGNFLLTP